jgi:transposase
MEQLPPSDWGAASARVCSPLVRETKIVGTKQPAGQTSRRAILSVALFVGRTGCTFRRFSECGVRAHT